jgi:hypothetical protein
VRANECAHHPGRPKSPSLRRQKTSLAHSKPFIGSRWPTARHKGCLCRSSNGRLDASRILTRMPKIGRPAWSGRRELLMAESFLNWQAGPSNVGIWVKLASARTSINESEVERTRGADSFTESMFTVLKLGDFVPDDHGDSSHCLCGRRGRGICQEPGHSILGKCAHLIGRSARHSTDVLIRAKRRGATRQVTYESLMLTNTRCLVRYRTAGRYANLSVHDERSSAKRNPP